MEPMVQPIQTVPDWGLTYTSEDLKTYPDLILHKLISEILKTMKGSCAADGC